MTPDQARERIRRFADLKPGWYYAALPIAPEAIETALVLVDEFPADRKLGWPVPTVRGGVQFEWPEPDVELEVFPDRMEWWLGDENDDDLPTAPLGSGWPPELLALLPRV